ncbi:hypothetical protein C9374_004729 [Naegleria lovaniensis]|uniref:Uncharacterized protein n=1 Tax=Naegleria lovaniensis TaxID=51637 RepID=A0AA88GR28_NAELO|nr:uncharacterized protein C9374_004729 [Naegleria lovaniensis]KAG2382762.1 hypothetical protein C9374_004729 [Naegleria lovaniensis]
MSHNNPPSISGRVHTTIDVEPSCNDKSFLLYLERILSVHIIIDWQRRLQEVMRVRTEGEAILPSHWEVLLSSIINILNVVLDKGQTEISELDKISFSGSVFGIILESTTSAAEDIAGVGQWSRGFKKVWYLLDSLIKKLVVRSLNQEEQELLFEYNAFIRRKSEAQDEEESSSARQWKISHLLSKPQVSHVRIMDQFENSNWRKRNALRRYFSPTIFKRKETPKEMESWKATGTGPYCSYQTSFSGSRDDVILNKLGHSSSEEISDTTTPSTELTETSQTVTDRTSHP